MLLRGADREMGGFTLLEAMIALVIAALVLGLFLANIRGGLRAIGVSEHRAQALSLARSYLDAAGIIAPLTPGTREEQATPGFYLRQSIALRDRTQAGLGLYEVRVEIMWVEGADPQSVGLTTLLLAGPSGMVP